MKTCRGCKHLVGFGSICKGDEQLTRHFDPLTGGVHWRDDRFPNQILRPSPGVMRAPDGRCGPSRKLYAPTLLRRLLVWVYGEDD